MKTKKKLTEQEAVEQMNVQGAAVMPEPNVTEDDLLPFGSPGFSKRIEAFWEDKFVKGCWDTELVKELRTIHAKRNLVRDQLDKELAEQKKQRAISAKKEKAKLHRKLTNYEIEERRNKRLAEDEEIKRSLSAKYRIAELNSKIEFVNCISEYFLNLMNAYTWRNNDPEYFNIEVDKRDRELEEKHDIIFALRRCTCDLVWHYKEKINEIEQPRFI